LLLFAAGKCWEMNQTNRPSFYSYFFSKENRFELFSTVGLMVFTYAALLWIYPFPNIYADTGAYISVAGTGLIGNYRPPGFSWFMAMSHSIHPNADVLVALQTILYFFSTLFLYLTAKYFFYRGNQFIWRVFFFIFQVSPTVIYLCNFVISDSLFISLTNLWVASLLWIIATKKPGPVVWNTLLVIMLILVRYIALFYPLLTIISLFIACFRHNKIRLALYSLLHVAAFLAVIFIIISETKKNIGVAVLSGFGGWQKANNALHIVPYINLKPEEIEDAEIRKTHAFIIANNPREFYPAKDSVVVLYLWASYGPLKKYMVHLQGNGRRSYQYYWHLASVPMGNWADYLVKKYPLAYLKYYIKPNFLFLFKMSNEALFVWPEPSQQMKDWFECNNCALAPRYNFYHNFLAATASKTFNILWVLLVLSIVALLFRKKLNCTQEQYWMLWVVSFFCIAYIAMSVYASPIVLRYLLVIRHSLVMLPFLVLLQLLPFRRK